VTDAVATPSGGRWRRAATRLAHQQPALLALALALAVFLYDAVASSTISLVLVWVAMCVVLVSVFAEGFHNLTLCPICARAIPIDGQEQARVRSDWLRLHHRLRGVAWSVVLFAGCLAVVITLRVPAGIAFAPVYVSWVVEAVANLRHRPLQPWCPQCRWWYDGDDDEAPVMPVPPSVEARR
jgi:hypothetical protein